MGGEELKKKLEALVEDEAFLSELKQADSKNDLQTTLCKYGIKLNEEEVDAFAGEIEKQLASDEVSESDLEQVSGGVTAWAIFGAVVSWGKDIWKKCWGWGKKFVNFEDKK